PVLVEEDERDVVDADVATRVGAVPQQAAEGAERAGRAQDVEDRLLDQVDQAVQVEVVLPQDVGQRLEQVVAEVLDDVGRRVVLQQVAYDRQLDAHDLAVEALLHRQQQPVQAVDHDRRVAEQGEDARLGQAVEVERRQGEGEGARLALEHLDDIDADDELVE